MSPASTTSPRARSSDAKRGASVHKGPDRMFASSTSAAAGSVSGRSCTCTCRAGPGDALMVWAYPQTLSEAQRVEVFEPLALPDALGQLVHADEVGVQTQRRSERAPDAGRVAGLHEQALQKGPRPQTELSGQG